MFGQESPKPTVYSLSYYLTKYPTICRGTVVSADERKVKVKVTTWIKNKQRLCKKMKFRNGTGIEGSSLLNNMGVEIGHEYIFIGGTSRNRLMASPLRNIEHRFKIINDSLFIPTELLKRLPDLDSLNIAQIVTFNDPKIKTGFKISVLEFMDIYKILSTYFSWQTPKSIRYAHCIEKNMELVTYDNLLINGLLIELEELWELSHCK